MDNTLTQQHSLQQWLDKVSSNPIRSIKPLAGDASFRRYFRVLTENGSLIAMDASPEKESCRAFVSIAKSFKQINLQTPQIIAQDLNAGFLLMTDFGDQLLLDTLTPQNVDAFYTQALDQLQLIQQCQQIEGHKLARYNDSLYGYYEEMSWFITWYLLQYRKMTLTAVELAALERELHKIAKCALEQPIVCVHRDFHSRNIMVTPNQDLGILDFQDAAWGAITYDAISLLRDCYIDWPLEQVTRWALQFQQRLLDSRLLTITDEAHFMKWFDWMSLQRHLKCIGLFVRLNLRDGKSGYLQYIPRMLRYIQQECANYSELTVLRDIIHRE